MPVEVIRFARGADACWALRPEWSTKYCNSSDMCVFLLLFLHNYV